MIEARKLPEKLEKWCAGAGADCSAVKQQNIARASYSLKDNI